MKETDILKLYEAVVQETGFVEDTARPGWMPKLGPDDYRSVIRHGTYQGEPAMLKVSPEENLAEIAERFLRYQKEVTGKEVFQVPTILTKGSISGAQFLIQAEALEGVRPVKNWPLATLAEKEEIARLYWNTVINFPSYDLSEWGVSDYFVARMNTALAAGRDYRVQTKGFISAEEKNKVIQFIFTHVGALKVEAFFAHFSNTDIVKADGILRIWESPIVPKPEAAGIALWLWGATLYAYAIPVDDWKKEVDSWVEAFTIAAPTDRQADLKLKININLVERFLSTLLLDLPLKRSPFDKLSDAEVMKARESVRGLLNDIVAL